MALNLYGDVTKDLAGGHGIDVATQRADDLDRKAIDRCMQLVARGDIPTAWDLACGAGGQARRMVDAGAHVLASDIVDFSSIADTNLKFSQVDMLQLTPETLPGQAPFDVVVCQRALHYLTAAQAFKALAAIRSSLASDGRLYISVSGLHSELGHEYVGAQKPASERFALLSEAMQEKHSIRSPVCLYAPAEFEALLHMAGFSVVELFTSPFGNVKAVATVTP